MSASPKFQTVIFREGAVTELAAVLEQLSARQVFFVVDTAAYTASGAASKLNDLFANFETAYFDEFELNPQSEDVIRGIQLFEARRPDVIVGLGGGTAIDLLKLIGGLAFQNRNVDDLITQNLAIAPNEIPTVVIPTTAGTGSEATHFAVVYHNRQKYSVAHPTWLPSFVLLDPELTYSLPPKITTSTGLDALCQAIESIWAVGATDESVDYAARSLRLTLANLDPAVRAPHPVVRRAMCEAAHLAGKAINITKTTAAHALSYWLTTQFGVPHGIAVAIFIGCMLEYNADVTAADCNDPRGPAEVRRRIDMILAILAAKDAAAGRAKLEALITSIGGSTRLRDVGIVDPDEITRLAGQANVARLTNNPRRLDVPKLVELLTNVL
jgi:alcohol dehydrogenase class IV